MVIDLIYKRCEIVRDKKFLKKPVEHELKPASNAEKINIVLLPKLMQQILRPLNGPCNKLRVEHHIEREDTKMPLRLLVCRDTPRWYRRDSGRYEMKDRSAVLWQDFSVNNSSEESLRAE